MASSTSSFRISDELKVRLDSVARRMNKGKNRVITEALQDYLDRHDRIELRQEARRQSLLAGRKPWKDQRAWETAAAEAWDG